MNSVSSVSEGGYSPAEGGVKQEYGIAIGSPGGDVLMNAVRVRGAAYGSARAINAPTHLSFQLTLPPAANKSGQQREEGHAQSKETETEEREPMPVLAAAEDETAEGRAPALGRRRRMSSRGASDKRRVAIMEVSDSDTSGLSVDCEGEGEGKKEQRFTDGFCRAEAQQHPSSVSPSPSHHTAQHTHSPPPSSLPPSSTLSANASALLSRRGLPGKFLE